MGQESGACKMLGAALWSGKFQREAALGLLRACLATGLIWVAACGAGRAETDRIRIGLQYGLPYMQLVIMQDRDFLAARAKAAGMPGLKAEFVTMGGPAVLNDSLISGALDVGAIGMSNMITLWDKTRASIGIRALSGMNIMPLLLVTRDPRLKTVADYGPNDRIALPGVKVSMQAMMLDILAGKAFGDAEYRRLDPNTVSMGHPDATTGMLAGGAAFTSHFSALPYQHFELAQPGVHVVASTFDAIGPHSVSALSASTKFRTQNPVVVGVFMAALQDCTDFINQHRMDAAEAYLRVTKDKTTAAELVAMMGDEGVEFTLRPRGAQRTADFMFKTGVIKQHPQSWQDMYFDTAPPGGS